MYKKLFQFNFGLQFSKYQSYESLDVFRIIYGSEITLPCWAGADLKKQKLIKNSHKFA